MTPERGRQIFAVFHGALARDAETRESFLDQVCAGDEALRAEVIGLLDAHHNARQFGERPLVELLHDAADVSGDLGTSDIESVPGIAEPGMTLGSYRIERSLGRGGMGVVYLAYDTTLHRQVALKVLGAPVAGGSGRARLLREARNAAALNHPAICTVYEVGEADGCAFIAMEYVEGRPLSDRLAESALPLQEAVQHGIEAADALGCAHDHGVIHRDLKAANAMVTTSGRLKLVDFGLARRDDAPLADATTMASLAPAGIAVGTPYSMAPEQVRGGTTDVRTDIWALGVLLYEMVSGAKPFRAPTTSELFSAILRDAPAPLPDATPVTLRSVIERCLEKESAGRYQHTSEVRAALEAIQAGRVLSGAASRVPARRRRWVAAAAGALALVTLLLSMNIVWQRREPDPPPASPGRFTFSQLTSQPGAEWFPSLSPDGKWLVYSGQTSGNRDIYLQSVGGQNPINLTADFVEDDDQPAFSPDGERIAFRSSRLGGGIFVMGLTGEAPRRVTSAGFRPSWSPDGTTIAYSTENVDVNPQNDYGNSELWLVDLETGKARNLNFNDALQASFSPDGRRLAVTARYHDTRQLDIVTVSLDGGDGTKGVVTGPGTDWNPVWSKDGRYLYYSSDRGGSMNLWRMPIDVASGQARGEPEPVTTPSTFAAHPSMSSDGKLLAFSSVTTPTNVARLSIDPASATVQGEPSDVTSGSRRWSSPDPSPDGQWVTFYSAQKPESVFIARADGTSQRQLTNDAAIDRVPRWSPDGDRIAFFSNRSGPYAVWTIHADGSGLRQVSGTEAMAVYPTWSHDGSRMATSDAGNASLPSLAKTLIFDPNRPLRDQAPEVLPPFPSTVGGFVPNSWSPDGQKLAGQISLTPQGIATYSLRSRTFDLLTDFGEFPVWLPDSRRLLFVAGGRDFFVLDTGTRQSRKVYTAARGVLGPPRLTRDGRSAYFTRRMTESDIWLMKIE